MGGLLVWQMVDHSGRSASVTGMLGERAARVFSKRSKLQARTRNARISRRDTRRHERLKAGSTIRRSRMHHAAARLSA
jgi:hypothetical protein